MKLKARIVKRVHLRLKAFRSGLIFRAAEHLSSLFLLTSEISMRDGGCWKKIGYGENRVQNIFGFVFASGLHSLTCPVVLHSPWSLNAWQGVWLNL